MTIEYYLWVNLYIKLDRKCCYVLLFRTSITITIITTYGPSYVCRSTTFTGDCMIYSHPYNSNNIMSASRLINTSLCRIFNST